MFHTTNYTGSQSEQYTQLYAQLSALLDGETDSIANLANSASLLAQFLPDINWCGWYRVVDEQLVLGPFIGLPACTRIAYGRGVCGTAWSEKRTQHVDDVHAFPGHIACDA
ncbi:MAG: GAF domain-containing protein, partial [Bacilli bacterium]